MNKRLCIYLLGGIDFVSYIYIFRLQIWTLLMMWYLFIMIMFF